MSDQFEDAWLLVIDPQHIFASPDSEWGSPMFADIVAPVRRLAQRFAGRVIVTRWVAPDEPMGSWGPYLVAWPMADVASDDPKFDIVPELAELDAQVFTATTFGKWGPALATLTGATPRLVVTGVSTDCCVISTALAAAVCPSPARHRHPRPAGRVRAPPRGHRPAGNPAGRRRD